MQHPRFMAFAAVEVWRDAERKMGRKIFRHFVESDEFIHGMKQKDSAHFLRAVQLRLYRVAMPLRCNCDVFRAVSRFSATPAGRLFRHRFGNGYGCRTFGDNLFGRLFGLHLFGLGDVFG